jgi:sulfate permease, SulP family
LIGAALSIAMFVPRAARITVNELTVGGDRLIRDRQPDDPPCSRMIILDLEGELFFGAAPELDRYFAELKQKINAGLRIIILRVKRTRNPDMVCMERFQHFLRDMEQKAVTVLLCGVRVDFDQAMKNLCFYDWLPPERIFRENVGLPGSATSAAVRYAYDILGDDVCDTCPRRKTAEPGNGALYYVI